MFKILNRSTYWYNEFKRKIISKGIDIWKKKIKLNLKYFKQNWYNEFKRKIILKGIDIWNKKIKVKLKLF